MPNLVVYVPADVARALEALGVPQNIQRKACQEVLVGLADGGLAAGAADPGALNASTHRSGRAPASSSLVAGPEEVHDKTALYEQIKSGKCPGYVPAGVRCKLCGQVHQQKGKRS